MKLTTNAFLFVVGVFFALALAVFGLVAFATGHDIIDMVDIFWATDVIRRMLAGG